VIVVDNSLLVPSIIRNEWSERARRFTSSDAEWIVPPLWQYEFTNVMVTFARAGRLTSKDVYDAVDEARLLVSHRVVAVDQHDAVRIAMAFGLSAYDAQYAALAHAYGVRCVTNDRQFASRAAALVDHLDDLPSPRG
jgi:predicted nucleic acid-binding protein